MIEDDNRVLNYRGLEYLVNKLKNNMIKDMLVYKGYVATVSALDNIENPLTGWVYHIEETGAEYFYNGTEWEYAGEIVDVHYTSEEAAGTKSVAVGGISENTDVSNISGKTVSQVFDMILFPSYAPQYVGPSLSISVPSNYDIFIFDTLPTLTASASKAYTATGANKDKNKVYGGNISTSTAVSLSVPSGSSSTAGSAADKVGSYTYSVAAGSFDTGTDLIKDSKGNIALGYAGNATTKTDATLTTTYLTASGEGYVVASRSNIQATSRIITAWYPIWIDGTQQNVSNSKSIQSGGKQGISMRAYTGQGTIATDWYIEIPTGKTLTVIPKDAAGNYVAANAIPSDKYDITSNIDSSTFNSHTIKVDRYIYKNGSAGAANDYKIIVS